MLNRTYPDRAGCAGCGDGSGLKSMRRIIHDFMRYNDAMQRNLAERLKQALPEDQWQLLVRVAESATALGLPLYIVGGLPRDILLRQPSADFDLVVEGPAPELAKRLAGAYGGKVTVHSRFGTAKWNLRHSSIEGKESGDLKRGHARQSLDFVTARSESYKHPAALPTVEFGTIADDLRRRDFSMNALAIRLDGPQLGELRDELGGLEDLEHGVVRALHDGSFVDDPTRMYRAVRYEQRYQFRIAPETLGLLPSGRPLVEKLSAQRIRHELDLILQESRADAMLKRLEELDLLKPIHPALLFDEGASRRLQRPEEQQPAVGREWHLGELRWCMWLMALPEQQIRSLDRRLHFHADLYASLVAASQLWGELESLTGLLPSQWVERLEGVLPLAVSAAYLASEPGTQRAALERYLTAWQHLRPRTTGHELKRLGIEPGPEYKSILQELRRAWLDGRVRNHSEEQEYLRGILERGKVER